MKGRDNWLPVSDVAHICVQMGVSKRIVLSGCVMLSKLPQLLDSGKPANVCNEIFCIILVLQRRPIFL